MAESTANRKSDAAAKQHMTVTPRQVFAAQVSIKGYKKLGRPIPPGLQRIADAKRAS